MQGVVSPAKPSDGGRPNDALTIEMARLGLKMFGLRGVAAGTEKPYGTVNVLVQAGYYSGGTGSVSFPNPFPTACIGVWVRGGCTLVSYTTSGFVWSGGLAPLGWVALGY